MSEDKETGSSVNVLETALMAQDPFKELLKVAADFIKKDDIKNLYNIDVMLTDRFIEYLRNGTFDDLEVFIYDVLAFTDSQIGDRLKEIEEGKYYFYRWEHFHDLCEAAIEGYNPQLIQRLIESRKHGKDLMILLSREKDGIRHNELSKKLDISPQYLSKLLKEFQQHDLVTRNSRDKVSIVKLGITGREYMREKENLLLAESPVSLSENVSKDENQTGEPSTIYPVIHKPSAHIASIKEEYAAFELVSPKEWFSGPQWIPAAA